MHIFVCAKCGHSRQIPADDYWPTCPNCIDDRLTTTYRGQWKVWKPGYTPTAGTLLAWKRDVDAALAARIEAIK